MAKALLIGGKAEQPLESVPRPAGLTLGGHEEEVAPWLQDPHHPAKERVVILDVLEEVDRRNQVKRAALERQLRVARLQDPIAHQLPGRTHVVALEVGADPGAAPLPEEVRGESGAAADLQAQLALRRWEPAHEGVHRLLLLERTAKKL